MQPTWNISKHLEKGGTYNFDHVRFKTRSVEMTNHIVGLKALYVKYPVVGKCFHSI